MYLLFAVLSVFCTFWLCTFSEFAGFSVGVASFSSAMLVLTRFAQIIALGKGSLSSSRLKNATRVLSAGFFKFIFPPLVIYWGISRGFSIVFMVVGLIVGLVMAVVALAIYNHRQGRVGSL